MINFFSVYRWNGSIEGNCVIAPSLIVPALPPLPDEDTEETRKNLSLVSHNGNIHAVVCVLPHPISGSSRAIRSYVIVYGRSHNGNIILRLACHSFRFNFLLTAKLGIRKMFPPRSPTGPDHPFISPPFPSMGTSPLVFHAHSAAQ